MAKLETYILILIGVVVAATLIMVVFMMNIQRSGYNVYGPGESMMGPGYGGGMMGPGYGGGMMGSGYSSYNIEGMKTEFESNGERIYYTGFNETGQRIPISYGTQWLYVNGGGCVYCHGVGGEGGVPVMLGDALPANITYNSLTTDEDHPYTDEDIKTAIRDGLEPSGEPLALTMPRWQMSDKDLNDTLEYIKTL